MPNCEKFEDLISLYIDDELTQEEILELLEHFDECPDCYNMYMELKQINENLKGIKIDYPENLTNLILDHIDAVENTKIVQYKAPKRKMQYISLAACACLAVMISTFTFSDVFNSSKAETLAMSTSSSMPESALETTTESAVQTIIETAPTEAAGRASNQDVATNGEVSADEKTQIAQDAFADNSENIEESIPESAESEPVITGGLEQVPTDNGKEYAFVFMLTGPSELPEEIEGNEVVVFKDNTCIIVKNSLPTAQNVIAILEKNGYENISYDEADFNIDNDAEQGLIIIKH